MKVLAKLVLLCSLLTCAPVFCPPAEATVSTTAPRNDYVGNGATATYSYTFKIFAATDLRVTTRTTANVETALTYPTDYTVTGVGNSAGGTIVLTAGNLTTDYALTIRFDRTPRQSTDLRNQGSFLPQTHEDKFDELTRYSQQIEDVVDRSLHLPETEVGTAAKTTLPVAADRASKFLAWDGSGNPIAAAGTSASLTPVSSYINTLLDDANAAAARTTLDVPSTAEAILDSLIDAKGDLLTATAADTPARLAVGVDGLFLGSDSTQATGLKWVIPALPCQFRLTLTSSTPVTTGDVTAATTVYLTPYGGDLIALYDGTRWVLRATAQLSIAVPATTNTMYDVFVYDNSGTPTLELTAWTNDTTRATALAFQNGVYVKSGSATRRYVGSFRTTGVSGQTESSLAKRYVWNYYNRVDRPMAAVDTTNSWTYTTNTIRQANANTANQLDFIIGVSEDPVEATVAALFNNSASAKAAVYIGLDSTTTNSAQLYGGLSGDTGSTHALQPHAHYRGYPGAGRHYLTWLESSTATGTTTWYGDNGVGDQQSGMIGATRG